jgi:hypothetical protein
MKDARRFQLDELTIRPGTYFNPQTEVMIVVDDSPEVDHEIFNMEQFEGAEWVLISEDAPLDEHKRDELVDLFEVTYQPGSDLSIEHDLGDEEGEEEDEEEELLEIDELEVDPE